MKKTLSILLAFAMLACLFTGCTSAEAPTNTETGTENSTTKSGQPKTTEADPAAELPVDETLTIIAGISESLSPVVGIARCMVTIQAIYGSLLAFDVDGNVVALQAESFEEDSSSVTIHLRKDITFHNGDKMTADDVVYTYDQIMQSLELGPIIGLNLASWEKIDEYTVKFTKVNPTSNLLIMLAQSSTIIPKEYHMSVGQEGFEKAPVGAGPYKFVSKDSANVVTLEAFDGWVGEKQGFKHVIMRPTQDPASALIALEAKEVDFVTNVPAVQATQAKNDNGLTVIETPGYGNIALSYYGEPFVSDINLRKAIFHCINTEAAVILGAEGAAVASKNMLDYQTMGDAAGSIDDFVGYNEELAKEYLTKSNYKGEEFKISIYSGPALAESVMADMKRIGINASIEQLDMLDWMTKLGNGEIQLSIAVNGGLTLSREGTMDSYTYAAAEAAGVVYYAVDDEFEELMKKIKVTDDPVQRLDLVKQAHRRMYEAALFVPIYDPLNYCVYGSRLTYDYSKSPANSIYYVYQMKPAK